MKPPNVEKSWDKCNINIQAELLAYNQIREKEEDEQLVNMLKAMVPR